MSNEQPQPQQINPDSVMANANKAALQMASIVNGVTDVMAVMKNRIMELEAEVKALKEEKK